MGAVSRQNIYIHISKYFDHNYKGEDDTDLASLSSMITKIDDVLGQNNIDSTSCMQRAVCSYIRSTENNMKAGESDQMDEFIHMLSE